MRYAVFIIYGFGAVFPMALGIAMQFLKSSLTAANVKIVSDVGCMSVRLFDEHFSGNQRTVYNTKSCAALAAGHIRCAQLDGFSAVELTQLILKTIEKAVSNIIRCGCVCATHFPAFI